MLGSISPVGEASRGQRWWVTATAYTVASVTAGMAVGAALGATGQAVGAALGATGQAVGAALGATGQAVGGVGRTATPTSLGLLGVAVAAAAALDMGLFGWRVPTVHRQVDERWLVTYRGWVYGAGFGAQLGLGVATIVTSAATYTTLIAILLSASWRSGLLIGMAFGAARSAPLLLMARVRTADRLHAVTRRVAAAEPRVRRVTVAGQGALAAAALVAAVSA